MTVERTGPALLDHVHGDVPTLGLPTMSDSIKSDGSTPLTSVVSWPRPDVCVVHLAGDLDIASAPVLSQYLRKQTASGPAHLVLDLAAVRFLAAAGVGVIVSAVGDDHGVKGRLHLTGVTGHRSVERVLDITGLRSVLDVHDSLETLLDQLAPG